MKVVVIGGTHAGTAATREILKRHPNTDVVLYEKKDAVTLTTCSMPMWFSEQTSPEKLFVSMEHELTKLGAKIKTQHEVTKIDTDAHQLQVKNLNTNQTETVEYDKLVMATGGHLTRPDVPGVNTPNIFDCSKDEASILALRNATASARSIAVIGAGYTGVEITQELIKQSKKVTLIDSQEHALNHYFDPIFTAKLDQTMKQHDVKLEYNQTVVEFETGRDNQVVVVTQNKRFPVDMVILSTGVAPNTHLVANQLKHFSNGAILVNRYMQSSDSDVFAAGDCATVYFNPLEKQAYMPLATNAERMGKLIGINIERHHVKSLGTQGTTSTRIFNRTLVTSGLTKYWAKVVGRPVKNIILEQDYRPQFMPSTTPIVMELIWDPETKRVLGGSFSSKYDCSQSGNVISMAIQKNMTIQDLATTDMFFQPNYDEPVNYVSALAMAAVQNDNKKNSAQ